MSNTRIWYEFSQANIFEDFLSLDTFSFKKMFGGLALYYAGRLIALLMEDSTTHTWKGKTFPFAIWNGILLPTEREHHPSLLEEFPGLIGHPILGKWLYLPQENSDFESLAFRAVECMKRGDKRFGVYPKVRDRSRERARVRVKKSKSKSKPKLKSNKIVPTKRKLKMAKSRQ